MRIQFDLSYLMTRPLLCGSGFRPGMLEHRTLPQLLAPDRLVPGRRRDVDVLLAWGRRPSALWVEHLARRWDLPVWHLEDGLLRSVAKGRDHPPLALLVDALGVHFDATVPSRMEQLIAAPITAAEADHARALQRLWCEQRLSKLNPPLEAEAPEPYVLVVDQPPGIARSLWAWRMPAVFSRCFRLPWQTILIALCKKVHPDVISGRAQDISGLRIWPIPAFA